MAIDVNSIVHSPPHLVLPKESHAYFNKKILHDGEVIKVLAFVPKPNDGIPQIRIFRVNSRKVIAELRMLESSVKNFYFALIDTNDLKWRSCVIQVIRKDQRSTTLISEQHCTILSKDSYKQFYLDLFGNPLKWDWAHFWDTISPTETEILLSGIPLDPLSSILPKRGPLNGRVLYEILGPLITVFMARDAEQLPFVLEYTSRPPSKLPHIDLTKVFWLLINLAPCWADVCFLYRSARIDYGVQENELYIHFELGNPYIERAHPSNRAYRRRILAINYPNLLSTLVSEIANRHLLYKMDWWELEFSVSSFKTPASTTFS